MLSEMLMSSDAHSGGAFNNDTVYGETPPDKRGESSALCG